MSALRRQSTVYRSWALHAYACKKIIKPQSYRRCKFRLVYLVTDDLKICIIMYFVIHVQHTLYTLHHNDIHSLLSKFLGAM